MSLAHKVHFFLDENAHSAHIVDKAHTVLANCTPTTPPRSRQIEGALEVKGQPMLSDILVSRAQIGYPKIDLHRHATFACGMNKLFRKIGRLFG